MINLEGQAVQIEPKKKAGTQWWRSMARPVMLDALKPLGSVTPEQVADAIMDALAAASLQVLPVNGAPARPTYRDDDLLLPRQAAAVIGVTPQTIRNWIKWGLLPAQEYGANRMLVQFSDLAAIERQRCGRERLPAREDPS